MGQSAPLPYSEQGDRQPFDAAEWAKAVAGAVGILVVIVAAFIAVRHGLTLSYDKRGNGCQSLTGASAWTLELALLVPRLALVAWCGLTAAALQVRAARERGEAGIGRGSAGLRGALWGFLLAFVLAGRDPLMALVLIPYVFLPCAVCGLAWAVRATWRAWRRGGGPPWWTGLWLAWWLLAGLVLPVTLVVLADSGAVSSC